MHNFFNSTNIFDFSLYNRRNTTRAKYYILTIHIEEVQFVKNQIKTSTFLANEK